MPVYEYSCEMCNENLEIERSILDPETIPDCPKCNSVMKRVYGSFGIQFKGSGFYKTDNAK